MSKALKFILASCLLSVGLLQGQESSKAPKEEAAPPQAVKDSKNVNRKKILDAVRQGVVMISAKAYASADSGEDQTWSGTGFVVDLKNGLIATNHHVTGNMAVCSYEVKFSDGTTTEAKLKYFDPLLDFAFLQVEPKDFPKNTKALKFETTPIRVNDTIYAMGNSWGDEFSTYKGTVFSIYENLGPFPEQSFRFSGLTVGGASGSPVFNEEGKVLGILYGGKFVSGAALPIDYVAHALKALQKGEMPQRHSIGLIPRYEDLKMVKEAGLLPQKAFEEYQKEFPESHNKILVVDARLINSPAFTYFQPGDIIWKIEGQPIGPNLKKIDEVLNTLYDRHISIDVYREGKPLKLKVKPYPLHKDAEERFISFGGAIWYEYNERIRFSLGDPGPGVYISKTDSTSPFKDVLSGYWGRPIKVLSINGQVLKTLKDLWTVIPKISKLKVIEVRYIDPLGQQKFGDLTAADRHERFFLVKLKDKAKFSVPKLFVFNEKTLEWDSQDAKKNKEKNDEPKEGLLEKIEEKIEKIFHLKS